MSPAVKIIHSSYFPNIPSIKYLKSLLSDTENVIENIFNVVKNEHNLTEKDEVIEKLNLYQELKVKTDYYLYIPKKYKLWDGRYVRVLDVRNMEKIKLLVGGFLVSDENDVISLTNRRGGYFKFNKKNFIIFMALNSKDLDRISIANSL
jgi:hypothetical protein